MVFGGLNNVREETILFNAITQDNLWILLWGIEFKIIRFSHPVVIISGDFTAVHHANRVIHRVGSSPGSRGSSVTGYQVVALTTGLLTSAGVGGLLWPQTSMPPGLGSRGTVTQTEQVVSCRRWWEAWVHHAWSRCTRACHFLLHSVRAASILVNFSVHRQSLVRSWGCWM